VGRVRHFLGCAEDSDARVEECCVQRSFIYWRCCKNDCCRDTAALIHLDQHLKAESAGPEGVLLLEPASHVWSAESLQSFSADPKDECIIPNGMYARVIAAAPKRNP
jgi:hypothetical protein